MDDRELLLKLLRWFRETHPNHSVHCPSAHGSRCECWISMPWFREANDARDANDRAALRDLLLDLYAVLDSNSTEPTLADTLIRRRAQVRELLKG